MSKLDSFPNTLSDDIIKSLTEPKVHSTLSDIINILPKFSFNVVILVALAIIFIAVYLFTRVKNIKRKIVIKRLII